jgi:hypothetical protein
LLRPRDDRLAFRDRPGELVLVILRTSCTAVYCLLPSAYCLLPPRL